MKDKKKIIGLILLILVLLFSTILLFKVCSIKDSIDNSDKSNIVVDDWIPVAEVDITKVPENLIGYLSIPSLKKDFYINMPIKEGTDLNTLATAIGHFKETPLTLGNVCFAGHNSGSNIRGQYVGFFDKLKNLKNGDLIKYNNSKKEYTYKVVSNTIIPETDLSVLENSDENKITLITCVDNIENSRAYRRCVVATRIEK